jgi:glycosyltransferase involved in cell wall biosynthesis
VRELVIDVTRLVDRRLQGRHPTGVDRVGLAYVEHFGARALALVRYAGRWIVMPPSDSDRLFATLLAPGVGGGAALRLAVARRLIAPAPTPRGAWLINTGHSGLDRDDYAHHIQSHALRPLFFVHDLIPLTHPQYCRAGEPQRHRRRLDTVLQHGQGVVVNSAFTLRALQDHARRHGQALPPTVVAPLAPAALRSDAPPPMQGVYFLMLGTIEPRKNYQLVLQVWRELATRLGAATPRLVVVGQVGWDCDAVMQRLHGDSDIRPHVVHEASCDDARLAAWMRHARALLFPSFVEGYGLPLVEALSMGVPAIVSDLPVFHEVAGDVPEFLGPLDATAWLDRIIDYAANDSARRAGQLERLERFSAPTWAQHFARVESLLERAHAAAA